MKFILDTHILIWWLLNDEKLPDSALSLIKDPRNQVLVSVVSAWEISIKVSLKKLQFPLDELEMAITNNGFNSLAITISHAVKCATIPMHHQDPFDRMLIAQSSVESARLLTHDKLLTSYGDDVYLI